jgi:hypothetical protein
MPAAFPDGDLDHAAELGAVDSAGVRIWVRDTASDTVRAELRVAGQPPVEETVALSAGTDWTGVLHLSPAGSAPGAAFTCVVGDRAFHGRLAPAPLAHSGLTFGFGSCNRPFLATREGTVVRAPAAALYPAMCDDLKSQAADFLLLAGDQIYSDELAPVSVENGLSGDEDHPPSYEEALAAYRRVSRGFLGEAGFRRLREEFPTYCIWDDHDIFNCWGSRLAKSPRDHRLFEAACRAYGEYQHTRNPGGRIGPPPYHYTFRRGDVGFLALDLRGARDYERGQLLGHAQWQAIQEYLAGEDAATIHTLFVVASIPIAHVSRWMALLCDHLPGNNGNVVRDRWCSSAFIKGRDALLEALFRWQTGERYRQVILLSGDVHCASAFTIRQRSGRGRIEQFTSSALTTPDPLSQRTINRIAVRWPNAFERRFRFRRHLLTFWNNFGLVRATPLPDGGHRVSFTVRAWHPRQRRLTTVGQVLTVPRMPGR